MILGVSYSSTDHHVFPQLYYSIANGAFKSFVHNPEVNCWRDPSGLLYQFLNSPTNVKQPITINSDIDETKHKT